MQLVAIQCKILLDENQLRNKLELPKFFNEYNPKWQCCLGVHYNTEIYCLPKDSLKFVNVSFKVFFLKSYIDFQKHKPSNSYQF